MLTAISRCLLGAHGMEVYLAFFEQFSDLLLNVR